MPVPVQRQALQVANGLLQRTIDRGELGVELYADPIHDGDNRKRNTSRDQSIFDCGRARFVSWKSSDGLHRANMALKPKGRLNLVA
jgi:hypothetical protein